MYLKKNEWHWRHEWAEMNVLSSWDVHLCSDIGAMKTILVFLGILLLTVSAKYTKFTNHVDLKSTGPKMKPGKYSGFFLVQFMQLKI